MFKHKYIDAKKSKYIKNIPNRKSLLNNIVEDTEIHCEVLVNKFNTCL